MALEAHLHSLAQRHQEIDMMLDTEMKHPARDDTRVHELKRLKLRIKDQIARLRTDDTET